MTRLTSILFLLFCISILTTSIGSKEIEFLEPLIVSQSLFDLSESQNAPNLLLDSNGYLLTYAIDGANGYNIKTIRLLTDPQFQTIAEYYIFDSTQSTFLPTAQLFESKKLLYFYDRLIDEPNNDTTYKQKLVIYNNEIPTNEELENSQSFYNLNKAYPEHPQFTKTDNRIYCEVLKEELNDPSNNSLEYFLRSIDFETTELYPPVLHFSANGKTAIIPYGDSLLIVKSWIFCSEQENLHCINWSTGYKSYIIYENKIQSIHSLSSKDVTEKNQQPDDIFVSMINNEYLFALRQSKQLVKINYETMNFEELLDLSLYTDKTYTKIIPIQTVDYCILLLIDEFNNGTIMRFDQTFQYIDSVTIPFNGKVSEISDFVYDPTNDMLSYAYTTKMDENSEITRIYLQSVLFDKELVLNPPTELPSHFTVMQNYPNPFNPITTINYEIPQQGHLVVDIYNMLGQKVSTLYDNNQTAGEHVLKWDANEQSSGMYLVKVTFDDQSKSIKTMLLK